MSGKRVNVRKVIAQTYKIHEAQKSALAELHEEPTADPVEEMARLHLETIGKSTHALIVLLEGRPPL